MSDESRDSDIERLVERQARGEAPGVPVDDAAFSSGQLDTRRSKSGLAASGLLGQTHVDIPGADVDSQSFITQQTGMPAEMAHHATSSMAAAPGVDTAYPDVVDRPEYIDAHMQPGVVEVPGAAVAQQDVSATQVSDEVAPTPLDANQYPDAVDQPGYIQAHSLLRDETTLAELRTPETEIQIGPSPNV